MLRNASPVLRILVEDLENINRHILDKDVQIDEKFRQENLYLKSLSGRLLRSPLD